MLKGLPISRYLLHFNNVYEHVLNFFCTICYLQVAEVGELILLLSTVGL